MGKGQSKLSRSVVDDLSQATNFPPSKIRMWHKEFMTDCPDGCLTLDFIVRTHKRFFPFGDPENFSRQLFRIFDENRDGVVTFPEFLRALSVTGCGDTETKLRWAFQLYDLDEDKLVSYDDMVTVIGYVYRMVGPMVRLPEDEDTAEKKVDKMFGTLGLSKNQPLGIDEFVNLFKGLPEVRHAMNLYTGLV